MATASRPQIPQSPRSGAWRAFLKRYRVPLMLAPVMIIFTSLFLGSLVVALLQSFGYAPLYQVNEFPTLRHYSNLIEDPVFWQSVGLTFYYAIVPTIVGTAFSVYLALLLRRRFRGKVLFGYIYKLPLMIPYLVGVALTILLFANGGLIARALFQIGPDRAYRRLSTATAEPQRLGHHVRLPVETDPLYHPDRLLGADGAGTGERRGGADARCEPLAEPVERDPAADHARLSYRPPSSSSPSTSAPSRCRSSWAPRSRPLPCRWRPGGPSTTQTIPDASAPWLSSWSSA